MTTKERALHDLAVLKERIEGSNSDDDLNYIYRGWGIHYFHGLQNLQSDIGEMREILNEIRNRPMEVCSISKEQGSGMMRLMSGVGSSARQASIKYLNEVFAGTRHLTICDPYFLMSIPSLNTADYLSSFNQALPHSVRSIDLFVKPGKRKSEVADGVTKICSERNIRLICRRTHAFHDRVWIADFSKAYVIGASFNGLGNKCAFILELPEADRKDFLTELSNVHLAIKSHSKSA